MTWSVCVKSSLRRHKADGGALICLIGAVAFQLYSRRDKPDGRSKMRVITRSGGWGLGAGDWRVGLGKAVCPVSAGTLWIEFLAPERWPLNPGPLYESPLLGKNFRHNG
jgi:hypothetical protein